MSIMVWGHRGHRHHRFPEVHGNAPYENSIDAYKQTLGKFMGVEADIVQSRDYTPHLAHDTLFGHMVQYEIKTHLDEKSRGVFGDRFIFQVGDDELNALRLKDGQQIPRLRHLLEIMPGYPGRFLNLELKGPSVVDMAVREVERAIHNKKIMPGQIVFSSFNLLALRSLRLNAGSRFKIGIFLRPPEQPMSQMYPNWPMAEQSAYYMPFSVELLQRPDIDEIQPDFFHVEYRSLSVESIEAINFFYPKAKIIVWATGEPHPYADRSLIDTVKLYSACENIYAVMTDFPQIVQDMMEQSGIEILKPNL